MSIGDILEGKDYAIYVGAAGSEPTTEVGGALGFSFPQKRQVTQRRYIGTTPSKTITGKSDDQWTFTCDLTSNDTGQRFIVDAYRASTTIAVGYKDPDGNGEWQDVKATGKEHGLQNADSPGSATYGFGGVADPVDIGAGPA